jgi:RNA recognition motif-containing protein
VTRANVLLGRDGRSKGCGIVEFATADDASQAVLTLNDTELKGRPIFVREDREDRPGFSFAGGAAAGRHRFSSGEQAQGRRVYVGNLSWAVDSKDLNDFMKQAGEVVHAEIMVDPHSGRSKGCGVVEFANEEDAQNAITNLCSTELKGRTIFVREDRENLNKVAGGGSVSGGQRLMNNPSVFVSDIHPMCSWQDLKDHMRKAGNVDSATIFSNQGGETNSGIVVYQRPQDAARAIRELQGTELHRMLLSVREDRMPSGGGGGGGGGGSVRAPGGRSPGRGGEGRGHRSEPGSQLFITNISTKTTWYELKDHFRACGDVKRADIKMTPQGESKGFGTVAFATKKEAEAAIQSLNGSELQGSNLEVRLDRKSR